MYAKVWPDEPQELKDLLTEISLHLDPLTEPPPHWTAKDSARALESLKGMWADMVLSEFCCPDEFGACAERCKNTHDFDPVGDHARKVGRIDAEMTESLLAEFIRETGLPPSKIRMVSERSIPGWRIWFEPRESSNADHD